MKITVEPGQVTEVKNTMAHTVATAWLNGGDFESLHLRYPGRYCRVERNLEGKAIEGLQAWYPDGSTGLYNIGDKAVTVFSQECPLGNDMPSRDAAELVRWIAPPDDSGNPSALWWIFYGASTWLTFILIGAFVKWLNS